MKHRAPPFTVAQLALPPRTRARRILMRRSYEAAREAQAKTHVAVCSRCHTWFPTIEERNYHRTFECPRRPGRDAPRAESL